MKNNYKLAFLIPIVAGFLALTGCGKNQVPDGNNNNNDDVVDPNPDDSENEVKPFTVAEFVNAISKDKNYTYTYEFFDRKSEKEEFKSKYKYEDKFTQYGMFSKSLFDTEEEKNFGWASNEKDGSFRVFVDENGTLIPGRAIRDGGRNIVPTYFDQVLALDDLTESALNAKLYKKEDNYRITGLEGKATIFEASQIKADVVKEHKTELYLNLENREKVEIRAEFGKNAYVVGEVTNIGNTEIPIIKDYIDSGKGAFIQTVVDPKLQQVIDALEDYNYETPLFGEIVGGERRQVGTTRVYKKVLNDKTAIVKFNDYEDDATTDEGLIQLIEGGTNKVYKFTVENNELILGKPFQVNDKFVETFKDEGVYELPNSLSAFNEDATIFEYDTINKMFVTYDTYVTVELCVYLDLTYSLEFAMPLCTVINPILDETNSLTNLELRYYWQDKAGNQDYTFTLYSNFGKVNLPFVDTYLEAL